MCSRDWLQNEFQGWEVWTFGGLEVRIKTLRRFQGDGLIRNGNQGIVMLRLSKHGVMEARLTLRRAQDGWFLRDRGNHRVGEKFFV